MDYSIIISLTTSLFAGFITYFITINKFKRQQEYIEKVERYKELVIKLKDFYGHTANTKNKEQFFEEYYKSWLYASQKVLKELDNVIESVKITNYTN